MHMKQRELITNETTINPTQCNQTHYRFLGKQSFSIDNRADENIFSRTHTHTHKKQQKQQQQQQFSVILPFRTMRTKTNLPSTSSSSKSGKKKKEEEEEEEQEEEEEDCPTPTPVPPRREEVSMMFGDSSIMTKKITPWRWWVWICFLVIIEASVLYSMRSWMYSGEPFFFATTTTTKSKSSKSKTSKIDTIRDAFDILGLDLDLDGTTTTTTTQDVIHHRSCLHLYEQQAFPHYNNYNYNNNEGWSSNNVGYDGGILYSPPLVHVTKLYTEEDDGDDTVLLLSKRCSKTIRQAYRKRALLYHPDNWTGEERNGLSEDENGEFFAQIVEAYEILTAPMSRNSWIKCRNVDGCRRGLGEEFFTLLTRPFTLTLILPFWPNIIAMIVIFCSMIWIIYYDYARVEASTVKQSVGTSIGSNNTTNNKKKNNNKETGGRRKRREYTIGDVVKAVSYIIKMWSELIQLAFCDNIAPSHGTGNIVSRKNSDSQQEQQQQQAEGTDFDRNRSSSNDWVVLPPTSSSSPPPKPKIA